MVSMTTPQQPISLITPDPAADKARRAGLRRMRIVAFGLLVFAGIVYIATIDHSSSAGFLGYVNAGAEASMIGAIADWFAVTALFRHPLGLPIPHTALVPRRKDELGKGLQEFVGENFLQEEIIRDRVAAATVSLRVGEWLQNPENNRRVVDEASELAAMALAQIKDEHVRDLVNEAIVPRFLEEPMAPLLGGLLGEAVRDQVHHSLVDLAVKEMHHWLIQNPDLFTDLLSERAPWWAPPRLNDAVTGRAYTEALRWLEDIRDNPRHHARLALDSMLGQLAHDLQFDPETQAKTERFKERVLVHPAVLETAVSLWNSLRKALLVSLQDHEGAVRVRTQTEIAAFADRLTTDEELRRQLDGMLADLTVFAVGRYGAELTTVISHTIDRWDGKEAANRIELHVGRDLQFIRINGTIVGGIVGVTIHAIAQVVH